MTKLTHFKWRTIGCILIVVAIAAGPLALSVYCVNRANAVKRVVPQFADKDTIAPQDANSKRRTVRKDVIDDLAAEVPAVEAVRTHFANQRRRIDSLHLRVRRLTTMSIDPKAVLGWPSPPELPKYLGTDEILVAFKGEKRYRRRMELDYRSSPNAGSVQQINKPSGPYIDRTEVWTGDILKQRLAYQGKEDIYRTLAQRCNSFGALPYLKNIGLAVADPTASGQSYRNLQELYLFSKLFARWPYSLVKQETNTADGSSCLVLEGSFQCELPVGETTTMRTISDRLWLDEKLGLALRKRELTIDGKLVCVVNSDFVEVIDGFWLPKLSRTLTFAPPQAPPEFRNRPLLSETARLCLWLVNKTPDALFELGPPTSFYSVLDHVPAFHIKIRRYRRRGGDEMKDELIGNDEWWGIRGVGRRFEKRGPDGKLISLVVSTPRWQFKWDPARDYIVATPSTLLAEGDRKFVRQSRDLAIWRSERMFGALIALEKDRINDREAERITAYVPPDPHPDRINAHSFDPDWYLRQPGTVFGTRVNWFDPKTRLNLGYRCGCRRPAAGNSDIRSEQQIEYPSVEELPKELFKFSIPRGATLEIADPELQRVLFSEGESDQ